MTKDHWLQTALTNDVLVAELLLRLKHSSVSDSDSDSSRRPLLPPPATQKSTIMTILPPRWGHRKNRSKSTAPKEHRGSPTTHLSWSGGGGAASTSDGPSDLSSGSRSVKANEGASISSYHNLGENPINKMRKMELSSGKPETEGSGRGFVLPDLNMTPNEDDMSMMMMMI